MIIPRPWLSARTARPSVDNSVKILVSLFGALLIALLASGHESTRDCTLCGAAAGGLGFSGAASAVLSFCLCAYALWVTFQGMRQSQSTRRLLESQSLLSKFRRAFDDNLTRSEFTLVATTVLSEFAQFFGADEVRLEIVEPRTGVTVEEYFGIKFPPPIEPEVKADLLVRAGITSSNGEQIGRHFLDVESMRPWPFTARTTMKVAAAVTTPLGRIGILLLAYSKPRRSFREDEISLLCSALSGLIQTAADHCKRRNREDLERSLSHAERVQAVGTLASGIAHEFNNILGALLGYGEMALQRAEEGEYVGHYLHEMMATARRAEFIVSQILTLSRSREQERRPINLVEAIRDALPLISASLPDLDVNAPLVPDEDCKLLGHPVELQQVVMNLCKNAFEASRGEIKVDINVDVVLVEGVKSLFLGLLQPGKYARVSISDNGNGISPDVLPHIFEPFFTTKAAIGGTGLGLAAVHGLVTAIDGRIDVTSDCGKGTSFELYFPHSTMVPTPINQFIAVPSVMSGNGQLIAILKPHCRDLAMLEEKIAALGYEPVGFLEIGMMEDWLSTQTPDLIMIDVRSIPPSYSARDIATMARGAHVALISHFGREEILISAIALRFTLLREPLSSRALADAIRGGIVGEKERRSLVENRSALPSANRWTASPS
ncbi:ATP-binding protein [Rhizobium sp. ZK1]|uniref:ATP-binding protein n=1 Tax=Rhizobium sp. ZK1 TaxID=3389872 RepID=UPI0039F68B7C